MFNPRWQLLRFVVLAAGLALVCSSCPAQFSNLDSLGEQLAKKLKPLKPHMIAVADLSEIDGTASSQGDYFAWFLSASIQHHGKKKIPIADHGAFDELLVKGKVDPGALSVAEFREKLSMKSIIDIIVMGTIHAEADSYTLHVDAVRILDSAILTSQSTSFRRSNFTDSLTEPFPRKTDYPVFKALDHGVKPPTCVHCQQPSYNDYARQQKVQGTALFDVLISPDGKAVQIHPRRLLGFGLDEQSFDAIRGWQFKPAESAGKPIAVIVQIEVTFHLY